jgi:hypothetical protein
MSAYRIVFLLFLLPFTATAQLITGLVLDENAEPLPYATVYLRGSTRGTTTNAAGEFRLPVEKPGEYEVMFQYLGYKQKIERVTVTAAKAARLRVNLEPNNLEIGEVTITTEDPAVGIMRKVIAKRAYYKKRIGSYTCDAYVKGFYKLLDAPKKLFGIEIGNMGGILDTNNTGVIYLSESVSRLFVQSDPRRTKEVMISSKISGNDQGFSLNRATLTEFNLYAEHINIDRDLLSPLASNAFDYYRFKLKGKYRDENGFDIYRIEVTPKRAPDPVFGGYLYVVDDWYNLAGADLYVTGEAIKQPVLDTLRIRQQFVPVEQPDGWCLLGQLTSLRFSVLGFKVDGFFNGVFSNYNLQPGFTPDFFDRETFRIEEGAPTRDSTYWAAVRPVPLTLEEVNDYTRKDSLQRIWKSKDFLDSLDRRNNRFKLSNLLLGYTWNNSYRRTRVSYPALYNGLQFNTVQGWLVNFDPKFTHESDEYATRSVSVEGTLNYGFAEQRLRPALRFVRRFESIRYRTLEVNGGLTTEQFNTRRPVDPVPNLLYSLWAERNYLKIFEKAFGQVTWSQRRPGVFWFAGLEFAERRALVNHSFYTLYPGDENRIFTPNAPEFDRLPYEPYFEKHRALVANLDVRLRFGETYSSYPKFRSYDPSRWPDLWLRYRKAIPGIAGSAINYDLIQVQLMQQSLPWGLLGYTHWNVLAGTFLNRRNLEYMDYFQPRGNQTIFGQPNEYHRGFLLLPYYGFGTDGAFIDAHLQHHWQGWLFDHLPLLRRLKLKEVLGLSIYYADRHPAGEGRPDRTLPYWEINFGLENIGINFFRPLRIDVASGFFGKEYYRTGVVIGVSL